MRDQQTSICRILSLERKCSDGAERLRSALENQMMNHVVSSTDVWDQTLSFFALKKTLLFHNGYARSSRGALRLFPAAAQDVAPLCCQ